MNTTIASAAGTAESVLEAVMKVEPTLATMASMFGGSVVASGVAIVQPEIMFLIPFLENALKQIAGTSDISGQIGAVIDLAKHLVPGKTNSPALAPTAQAIDFQAPK